MATVSAISSNESTSRTSPATVDLKFEIVVIRFRMSTARRSSTRTSDGGSTLTSTAAMTFV